MAKRSSQYYYSFKRYYLFCTNKLSSFFLFLTFVLLFDMTLHAHGNERKRGRCSHMKRTKTRLTLNFDLWKYARIHLLRKKRSAQAHKSLISRVMRFQYFVVWLMCTVYMCDVAVAIAPKLRKCKCARLYKLHKSNSQAKAYKLNTLHKWIVHIKWIIWKSLQPFWNQGTYHHTNEGRHKKKRSSTFFSRGAKQKFAIHIFYGIGI